jgi:hypothetical protein
MIETSTSIPLDSTKTGILRYMFAFTIEHYNLNQSLKEKIMLHSISWNQYFIILGIALVTYYAFIWLIYFKGRMPVILTSKKFVSFYDNADDDELNKILPVTNELLPLFLHKQNKHELIMALQKGLQQYQQSDEYFKGAINRFIIHESLDKCSIHLGEEDLRVLWLR